LELDAVNDLDSTPNRFAQAFGVRTRPRVAFSNGAAIESDARTHRTPKAARAKSLRDCVYFITCLDVREFTLLKPIP